MQLEKTCRNVNVGNLEILSEDLNVKFSNKSKDLENVIGNNGIAQMKEEILLIFI